MSKKIESSPISHTYLYEIPLSERKALCHILDLQNAWCELATRMQFEDIAIQEIQIEVSRGSSGTDELLTMWSEYNHNCTELFVLLSKMQQYKAMETIKKFVDKKYHRLIISSGPDLSLLENIDPTSTPTIPGNVQHSNENNDHEDNETNKILNRPLPEESELKNNPTIYNSSIPEIKYNELVEATDNWSERNILGKGGFATVFVGSWRNTKYAIKRVELNQGKSVSDSYAKKTQLQQSLTEMQYLNSCRHPNVLALYGYSMGDAFPCLVYELMACTLDERLKSINGQRPLPWKQRLLIAEGTARGLQYLHTFKEKPLIHGDIKPANILLDSSCIPKIGDFGLSREGPNSLNSFVEVSRVYGTQPYLPAEFLAYKQLSTKVDCFSFGVVLYELATGQRAYSKQRKAQFLSKHMKQMALEEKTTKDLIDTSVPEDDRALNICAQMIYLGNLCTCDNPQSRPEMMMVLHHLITNV